MVKINKIIKQNYILQVCLVVEIIVGLVLNLMVVDFTGKPFYINFQHYNDIKIDIFIGVVFGILNFIYFVIYFFGYYVLVISIIILQIDSFFRI